VTLATGARPSLLAALALCASAGCGNQEPDVVARIQYLDASTPEVIVDAGNPLDLPSAEPGVCSGRVLAIHSVLSNVGPDCRVVSDNPQTQLALLGLLGSFAPTATMLPGEVTGISYCDRWEQLNGLPLVFYFDRDRSIVLCPSYCASVLQWVAENNAMVFACLERGQ
jgi:hypothetical protein